jgi:hypothetical protein
MDSASEVVTTLKKGDAVIIEMSIQGVDGAEWCSIREPVQKKLGYVRCRSLNRPPEPKAPALSAPSVPARPALPASSEDFWDREQRQQLPFGEMRWLGEAMIIARTSGSSLQQKAQVLLLARQAGIPSCIEDTGSCARRNELPPDIFNISPITQCDWNCQDFMERVLALIMPEQQAAHRASYEEQRRQIAGGRQVLERRSRERWTRRTPKPIGSPSTESKVFAAESAVLA